MVNTPQTVFITGGASGIGRAMGEIYLNQGANLAIFDLRIPEEVKQELTSLAPTATFSFHEVNVCDAQGLDEATKQAVKKIGAPELALNSAGIQLAKEFLQLSEEEFNRVIDINVKGSRNFAAAVLPQMNSGSQIAFVASLAGIVPNYTYCAYCASKFAVVGFAGALRIEQKARGIDVSVICPPEILTAMVVEELKSMHPITQELKSFADTISLDKACNEIARGLGKRKYMIIPGFKAKLTAIISRFIPGYLVFFTDKVVAKHSKQQLTKAQVESK